MALQEALEGLDFNELDVYVGRERRELPRRRARQRHPVAEIYRLFIEDDRGRRRAHARRSSCARRSASTCAARAAVAAARRAVALALRDAIRFRARHARVASRRSGARIPTGDLRQRHDPRLPGAPSSRSPGHTNDFRKLSAPALPGRHRPRQRRERELRPPRARPRADLQGRPGERGAAGALPAGRDRRAPLRRRRAQEDAARLRGARRRREAGDLRESDRALRREARRPEGPRPPRAAWSRAGCRSVLSQTFRAIIHSRMTAGLSKYRTPVSAAPTWCSSSPTPTTARSSSPTSSAIRRAPAGLRARLPAHAPRPAASARAELEPVLARHGIRAARGRPRRTTRRRLAVRLDAPRGTRRRPALPAPPRTCARRSSTCAAGRRETAAPRRAPGSEPWRRPPPGRPALDGNAVRTQRTRARILAREPAALQRAGRGPRHHRHDRRRAEHQPRQPLLPLPQQGRRSSSSSSRRFEERIDVEPATASSRPPRRSRTSGSTCT